MGIFLCSSFISNIFSESVRDNNAKAPTFQDFGIVMIDKDSEYFYCYDFQYLPVTQWSRELVIAYCDCLWRSTIPWETGVLHIFVCEADL